MSDWRTYDGVAETYERVHAPKLADVARDLLRMSDLRSGSRVLDVGTGTGVAARVFVEAGHRVTGIDESLEMLRVARRVLPGVPVAAAQALDLPFRGGVFDGAIGNFVLAHFNKVDTVLFDVIRVLRTGGKVAFSSWSDGVDAYQEAWREMVESVVPREILGSAWAEAAPGHEKFRKRVAVEEALIQAGLRHVRTEIAKYHWTYRLDDYLEGLEVWATGRFVRDMLGDRGWENFRTRTRAVFAERFPDPLNDFREVVLAVGTKV